MKKIIISIILILVIASVLGLVNAECNDSDGSNYYLKGKIINTLNNENYNDACVSKIDSGNVQYYAKIGDVLYKNLVACYGENCYVAEAVCSGEEPIWNNWEAFKCENGCKDGACLNETIVTPEPFCSDSDGLNYFSKGSVKDNTGERFDYCKKGDEGDYVAEYFCDGNIVNNKPYLCANGCNDGACNPETINKCTDSDNGLNYYEKGTTKWSVFDGSINSQDDYCLDDKQLSEGYCLDNPDENGKSYKRDTFECPNGCKDGVCIKGELISEKITCKFEDSKEQQQCYLAGQWGPEDEGTKFCKADANSGLCVITYSGYKGEQITWKSSCGQYQYTTQDGNDEVIYFKCNQGEVTPIDIKNKGFMFANWQCQNGEEQKSEDKTSCKLSETWQQYAKDFCEGKCTKEESKGGCVSTFSVLGECYTDEVPIDQKEIVPKPKEPVLDDTVLVCKDSCPLDSKCYPFGYRKDGSFCSDNGKFIDQLKADNSCENNFECDSNLCINNSCVSGSLWQKIMTWFSKLFGGK